SLGRMTNSYMPKANASATLNSTTGNLTSTPDTNYETDYTYYGDGTTAAPPRRLRRRQCRQPVGPAEANLDPQRRPRHRNDRLQPRRYPDRGHERKGHQLFHV